MSHILEIKDLQVQYHTEDGTVYALNHVDLELDDGETLGLVGETGAGKIHAGQEHHAPDSRSPQARLRAGSLNLREGTF